jgi:hypothetical protein
MCWQLQIHLLCGHIHLEEINYCSKNPKKRDEGWIRNDPKICPQWRVVRGGEGEKGGELGPVKEEELEAELGGELAGICRSRGCVKAMEERKRGKGEGGRERETGGDAEKEVHIFGELGSGEGSRLGEDGRVSGDWGGRKEAQRIGSRFCMGR